MDTETPTTETEIQPKPASLLASEVFGSGFHGEVAEPEVINEETPPQETSETETVEIEAEAPEGEEVENEAETEQKEQEQPISSFSELVEHLEADPEWANSLEMDVKINGEPGKAKLADVIASYQTQEAATQRLEESKAKAKEITNELAQEREQVQQQFAVAAELIQDQKTTLDAEEAAIDWATLKKIDPAEYSAKKLDFQDRKAALNEKINRAAVKYQESVQANQAKLEAEKANHLQNEQELLYSKIEGWKDPEVANAEKAELGKFLLDSGLSGEEISEVTDHRLILLARKAMLYDKTQGKIEPQKKRLLSVPKVLKPGASKPAGNPNQTEIARLKKLLSSGKGDIDTAFRIKQLQRAQ